MGNRKPRHGSGRQPENPKRRTIVIDISLLTMAETAAAASIKRVLLNVKDYIVLKTYYLKVYINRIVLEA